MTQLELTLARRSDPVTSHRAADQAREFAASHEGVIYGALIEAGERGRTAREIADGTRLDTVQIARRMIGMERKGTVARTRTGWAMRKGVACPVYEERGGFTVWRVA